MYIQVYLSKINFCVIEEMIIDLSMDPILLFNNGKIL